MSIYSFIASRKPVTFLEIGSGHSTKFARRAVRDQGVGTKIVSVDPYPREEISDLCDEIIRQPLELTDLSERVRKLQPNDILFFDGSHRCFQNSDVTVFFNELIWHAPPGVLIGIHDIFLPYDYPEEWLDRYDSEQYVLAGILLADRFSRIEVHLPCYFAYHLGLVDEILEPLWADIPSDKHHGGCFWFSFKQR